MISAADFSDVFPWMAERKPQLSTPVEIKPNSGNNVEDRDEFAHRVDAAVSANRALLVAANPSIPAHRAADQSTIESTVIQIRKANQQ